MTGQMIRLDGVSFGNPALPRSSATDEERGIAALPGLRFWMDPQHRFEPGLVGEGIVDRKGQSYLDLNGTTPYTFGVAIGLKPTVRFTNTVQGMRSENVSAIRFMERGYTIAAVVKRISGTGAFMLIDVGNLKAAAFVNDNLVFVSSNNGFVNNFAGVVTVGTPHVVLSSWDAGTGVIKVEVDGANQPLSAATMPVPDLSAATNFAIGAGTGLANGQAVDLGDVFIFDRPYASAENSGAKADLYALLGAKYGIVIA